MAKLSTIFASKMCRMSVETVVIIRKTRRPLLVISYSTKIRINVVCFGELQVKPDFSWC